MKTTEFIELLGKTMSAVECKAGDDEMVFRCSEGRVYKFYHVQDCCESVYIFDVIGDVSDLIGSPLVVAEEDSNTDAPDIGFSPESHTWTFYRFATVKGTVTVRWFGESNGYYSESVDFTQVA